MTKDLLNELIQALTILPGVGKKSAQRMALYLLDKNKQGAKIMASTLLDAVEDISRCKRCRMLTSNEFCKVCSDLSREDSSICVVESPSDVLAIESTGGYKGKYFVLLGRLSPIDGVGPEELGIEDLNLGGYSESWLGSGADLDCITPVDGTLIAKVKQCNSGDYETIMQRSSQIFKKWRMEPAPKRGEVVRNLANAFRKHKTALGKLISWEMGKIQAEGEGEVQEMIDICDFAVGLSRQLYGLTMHSERPNHRMYEQYHPLGIIGIISAFNFPVAVWSWNVALAWVCGNVCIWKPSEKTPLCSIVCQKLIADVLKENSIENGVSCLINGDSQVGKWMSEDNRINLLSATGSTRMGFQQKAELFRMRHKPDRWLEHPTCLF